MAVVDSRAMGENGRVTTLPHRSYDQARSMDRTLSAKEREEQRIRLVAQVTALTRQVNVLTRAVNANEAKIASLENRLDALDHTVSEQS